MTQGREGPRDLSGNYYEQAADSVGLRYVSDQMPGFSRRRCGRGFVYLSQDGKCVGDAQTRRRFDTLRIPPAWNRVWICAKPDGHIQATGRDDRGRKQYIYHPRWEETRNLSKFNNMVTFAEALPIIRESVDKDLRRQNLSREKVLAIVVGLLEKTLIRIGNCEYRDDNQTFGLTTLSKSHLNVSGSSLVFAFKGKSGVKRRVDLKNRRLARLINQCQELPGQELFRYVDGEGGCHTVESNDVNVYLRGITGQDFTAKYFRTWGGTVAAASRLYILGLAESKTEEKRNVAQAVKHSAGILGNTPAVCRKYYVHPQIINSYLDRTLFSEMQKTSARARESSHELSPEESAVANILRCSTGNNF